MTLTDRSFTKTINDEQAMSSNRRQDVIYVDLPSCNNLFLAKYQIHLMLSNRTYIYIN